MGSPYGDYFSVSGLGAVGVPCITHLSCFVTSWACVPELGFCLPFRVSPPSWVVGNACGMGLSILMPNDRNCRALRLAFYSYEVFKPLSLVWYKQDQSKAIMVNLTMIKKLEFRKYCTNKKYCATLSISRTKWAVRERVSRCAPLFFLCKQKTSW